VGILVSLLLGCAPEDGAPSSSFIDEPATEEPTPEPTPELEPCGDLPELTDVAVERGLDHVATLTGDEGGGCMYVPGALVAHDLDADGDIDVAFGHASGAPALYANDGAGHFDPVPLTSGVTDEFAALDRPFLGLGAADLDGDGLPELLASGQGVAVVLANLGGMAFAPPEVLYLQEGWPRTCFQTLALGDVDGDHDLDLLLPGLDPVPEPGWSPPLEPEVGTPERLLLNREGEFELVAELIPEGGPWLSLMGHFTDREGDGDLDLLVGTDRAFTQGAVALYSNEGTTDGGPLLADAAVDLCMNEPVEAMGLASADLDGDGLLDYCMSSSGPIVECLLSSGGGQYVASGAALGLQGLCDAHPDWPSASHMWVTWGFELLDLENDGLLDAAVAAGVPPDGGSVLDSPLDRFEPDELWRGTVEGRFERIGAQTGFDDPDDHYGLVAADFAGDGFLDLLIAPAIGRPLLWDNAACGDGAWLQVDLLGPPANSEGYGAQVLVHVGDRVRHTEMANVRSVSQGPSVLHFGLGPVDAVDDVEVRWPGGEVTHSGPVEPRQVLRLSHPGAGG